MHIPNDCCFFSSEKVEELNNANTLFHTVGGGSKEIKDSDNLGTSVTSFCPINPVVWQTIEFIP